MLDAHGMSLDELTDRVIIGAAPPDALLAWQHTPEGLALLDEPRTAWAYEKALERAVRESRGPVRKAVCEALLAGGFEHVIPLALSSCSRDELGRVEPELRQRLVGSEGHTDLADLVRRALEAPEPGARRPGPLLTAALLRLAKETDTTRLETAMEAMRSAPKSPVATRLSNAFPSPLALDVALASGLTLGHLDAAALRAAADSRGLLKVDALRKQLRSPEAATRERALLLALLHGGHDLADAAVEAARGFDAGLVAGCAFACRRAGPGRNYVAAAVYFAFVDALELTQLIGTLSERPFRETSMLALAAAAERCRCPELDAALRREAELGQQDAMYALAHGRAASFVDDLLRWAGTPGKGMLRPTALSLLAESRSDAGVCHLVSVILDAPATAPAAAHALRDHGFMHATLVEQLGIDSSARVGGRAAATNPPLSEPSALGLVQLLADHGGSHADPLLARFETHASPRVVEMARQARRRGGGPASPYR